MAPAGESGLSRRGLARWSRRKKAWVATRKGRKRFYESMMQRHAGPVVEAFAFSLPEETRRALVERVARATTREGPLWRFFTPPSAEGKTVYRLWVKIHPRYRKNPDLYAHEAIHFLGKRLTRHPFLAVNALDAYFYWLPQKLNAQARVHGEARAESVLQRLRARLRPPLPVPAPPALREARYRKAGRALGEKAALLEQRTGKPGAGLFFIKLVCDGVPWQEAEQRAPALEALFAWQKRFAARWPPRRPGRGS